MLPDYATWAAVAGLGTTLAVCIWKLARPPSVPGGKSHPWLEGLRSLGWGALAASAIGGAGLSRDAFAAPVDLWIQILVCVGWAAAAAIACFYAVSVRRNAFWISSKSARDLAALEQALARCDAAEMIRIGAEAANRDARMSRIIDSARQDNRRDDHTSASQSPSEAVRYSAFDRLVIGRAALALDAVSRDPSSRIGGELPETWTTRLEVDESQARQTAFEGHLALQLKSLANEIDSETRAGRDIQRDIEIFAGFVPRIFGGEMHAQVKAARDDLAAYESAEVAPENEIHARFSRAMRRRVSDRMYGESDEFRRHRDRFDRLAALCGKLDAVVSTARGIDAHLASAAAHLQSEQTYLALAAANTCVSVTHTRTNSEGQTETYTTQEDQSGSYRVAAAMEASAAASEASAAEQAFSLLSKLVAELRDDPTIESEGFHSGLPEAQAGRVDAGSGAWTAWFLPPLFGLFSSMRGASSVATTRASFAPVLRALEKLDEDVSSRKAGEDSWVNARISANLEQQIARAAGGPYR
jgi:hypothetical protein